MLHDWCNKGRGMYYSVCGMVDIKEPLLLIGKSSLCGGSGFPFSLSKWSLTICLTPYNRKETVLSASLNKTVLSLSPFRYLVLFSFWLSYYQLYYLLVKRLLKIHMLVSSIRFQFTRVVAKKTKKNNPNNKQTKKKQHTKQQQTNTHTQK